MITTNIKLTVYHKLDRSQMQWHRKERLVGVVAVEDLRRDSEGYTQLELT